MSASDDRSNDRPDDQLRQPLRRLTPVTVSKDRLQRSSLTTLVLYIFGPSVSVNEFSALYMFHAIKYDQLTVALPESGDRNHLPLDY